MLWAIVILLGVGVLVLLVEPFFRTQRPSDHLDEEDYLAAQISDIARDRDAGLISDAEANAADLEARRRLLAAHRAGDRATKQEAGSAPRQVSTMLVAAAPVAAFALYVLLGNPGAKETAEALRIAAALGAQANTASPSLSESVTALEARLAENPDVLDDWVMLAESYANLDRFDDAARAFAKARALAPEEAYLHAAEGESIAMAAGGIVTQDARFAFGQALAIDATEPRARFYLAIGAYQEGRREEALDALIALEKDAPPGVSWAPIVRSQIEQISGELGRAVEAALPQPTAAASFEAEIASGDASYQRWIALIDAYVADGDVAKARDAALRARQRYKGAPFVLQEIAAAEARIDGAPAPRGPTTEQMQAAQAMSPGDRAAMIEGMVSGLAARLENEPDDLEGWTMLARSYGVLEQYKESADAYSRAIALAPNDLNLRLGRAEALLNRLNSANEPIDAEAQAALDDVANLNPGHPFVLYFRGLAASQRGDTELARENWTRLIAAMPPDAAEAASIRELIDGLKDQ